MSNICEFCNKELSSSYTLKRHQQNARYCLDIQNKKIEMIYKCVCDKEFDRKDNYKRHMKTCKIKNDDSTYKNIKDLISVVKDLITHKPSNITNIKTITNNNINNGIVNNLIPLDPSFMKEQSKFLTHSHINDGPFGYARFSNEFLLKDRVICTDASRGTLMFKGLDNKPKVDIKGVTILKEIGTAIVDVNSKLCNEKKSKLEKELDIDYENTCNKLNKYCESEREIKRMSEGCKDTKFTRKILDNLCTQITSKASDLCIND